MEKFKREFLQIVKDNPAKIYETERQRVNGEAKVLKATEMWLNLKSYTEIAKALKIPKYRAMGMVNSAVRRVRGLIKGLTYPI